MKRLFTTIKLAMCLFCCVQLRSAVFASNSELFVKVQIKNTRIKKKIGLSVEAPTKKLFKKKFNILGRNYKISEYKIKSYDFEDEDEVYDLSIIGKKALDKNWQYYQFSFTPNKSGYLVIKLSGITGNNSYETSLSAMDYLVAYDYFKVKGAYLYNTNFEFIDKNALRGWYNGGLLLKNSNKARNGNYFVAALGNFLLFRNFKVNEDKKVTIGFFARNYEVDEDDVVVKKQLKNNKKVSKKKKKKVFSMN